MILMGLVFIFVIAAVVLGVQVIPFWNHAIFDRVWQDPTIKEREEVRRRLEELHVDGHVPQEMAVFMAAKEYNKTEEELLQVAQLFNAADIKRMATGRMSVIGGLLHGIERALKRGVKRA